MLQRNEQAAVLAAVGGALLIVSGYTGARPVDRLFTFLEGIIGSQPSFLLVLAYIFVGIASLGGFSVVLGSYLIWKNRVRTGDLLILIGSGAGFFTLLVFVLVNLRRDEFSFLTSVLPAVVGVGLGIAARLLAKPTPIL